MAKAKGYKKMDGEGSK